ncbi:beta-N-acetylhexosaminidase [Marinicrinis sediminis]|uniref:Beta-N-acetylhexosaminidase n=1 Tax=Marinicrinis sediminis TaxID=1652465 RepID=A0ABW5RCG0_9BACL
MYIRHLYSRITITILILLAAGWLILIQGTSEKSMEQEQIEEPVTIPAEYDKQIVSTDNGNLTEHDHAAQEGEEASASTLPETETPATADPANDSANDLITYMEQMSLQEKIAQMMYVGVSGTSLHEQEQQLIAEDHVGGIILLGGNIENKQQLSRYVTDMKKANQTYPIPLFIGADEEGGRVSRIPDSILNFPSNQVIGRVEDEQLSYEIGQLLARKVKSFGMNMNFAPVLDIHSNPHNQVIGDRAFGAEPDLVSTLGIATMKGMQSKSVIPVVKHFPGHGDTKLDSHVHLPRVNKSLQELERNELIPFRRSIAEGAEMVMVAHVLYPQLDDQYPASLSPVLLTDLLRKQMGFEGVVVTDDLSMGAITSHYTMPEAVIQSIRAGSDMVMVTQIHRDDYQALLQAISAAVESGQIPRKQIDDSVARILALKQRRSPLQGTSAASQPQPLADQLTTLNEDIQAVLRQIP